PYQSHELIAVLDGGRTIGINDPHAHVWLVAQHDLLRPRRVLSGHAQRRVQHDHLERAGWEIGARAHGLETRNVLTEQQVGLVGGRIEVELTEDIVGEHEGAALWLRLEERYLGAGGGVVGAQIGQPPGPDPSAEGLHVPADDRQAEQARYAEADHARGG